MTTNDHELELRLDHGWDRECLSAARERMGRRLGDGKHRSEPAAREEKRLKFDRAVGGDLVQLNYDEQVISEKPVR